MISQKTFAVQFKRKRKGKTNYKSRIKLLISNLPRLVVRKSLRHISGQIIQYDSKGDRVLASANSSELEKIGWAFSKKNIPAAYLTGLLLGVKAKSKIKKAVVPDLGFNSSTKGGKVFAFVKGVKDAGLQLNLSDEILPDETRISGQHIANFFPKTNEQKDIFKNQFQKSSNLDFSSISKKFQEVKKRVLQK